MIIISNKLKILSSIVKLTYSRGVNNDFPITHTPSFSCIFFNLAPARNYTRRKSIFVFYIITRTWLIWQPDMHNSIPLFWQWQFKSQMTSMTFVNSHFWVSSKSWSSKEHGLATRALLMRLLHPKPSSPHLAKVFKGCPSIEPGMSWQGTDKLEPRGWHQKNPKPPLPGLQALPVPWGPSGPQPNTAVPPIIGNNNLARVV